MSRLKELPWLLASHHESWCGVICHPALFDMASEEKGADRDPGDEEETSRGASRGDGMGEKTGPAMCATERQMKTGDGDDRDER